MKINKILVPILGLPLVLGAGLTTLVGCNKGKEDKFKTDDWQTVVEHANKGLNDLKAYYGLDSFVGLERTIKINGIEHKVRVIGENEDYLAGEDDKPQLDKPVALTFQFDNIISSMTEDGIIDPEYKNIGNGWGWKTSNVRKFLNEEEGTGLKPFIKQMEEQLGEDAIKIVSKKIITLDVVGVGFISEKIFEPALAEIYNVQQLNDVYFDEESYEIYQKEANTDSAGQNQGPYSYYKQNIKQDDESAVIHQQKCLIRTDVDGFAHPYWLRSAYITDDTEYNAQWNIWSNGMRCPISESGEVENHWYLGMAPIFCI